MATEAPSTKSGGAVVMPATANAIERAVDATDGLKASDICIEGVEPKAITPHRVKLEYRVLKIYFWSLFCVGLVMAVCIIFIKPKEYEKQDANTKTRDQVRARLKSLQGFLSIPRALLSSAMTAAMGIIIAVFCLDDNLRAKRTWIGKGVEWGVKHGLPYIFCLPLVGIVFQEQPMRMDLAIGSQDLGVYNSLLVTAADQAGVTFGNGSFMRTVTTDTILRRALLPPRNQLRQCDLSEAQSANEFTSVAYEFLANHWQIAMLPYGLSPNATYVVPGAGRPSVNPSSKSTLSPADAALYESLFTRGVYLYADSALVRDQSLSGPHTTGLKQLKLDTIAYANTSSFANVGSPTDHVATYVRSFFSTTPAWSSLLRANVSDITVEFATFNFTNDLAFTSVTIDVPLESTLWHRELAEVNDELVVQSSTWPGTGPVLYEFDVANECGPRTCGIENRGLAPEPKVVAYAVCPSDGSDCTIYTNSVSMWLFGFGRRIEGDRLELLEPPGSNLKLRKAVLTSPREYHRITMGFVTFNLTNLAKRYNAECRVSSGCTGIYMPLDDANNQTLTVSRQNTPMLDFGSGFDLSKNHARGKPLVTRYTTGAHVDYEILRPQNFDTYVWPDNGLWAGNCSGKMERSIITTELNHVYMEQPLQVTYTAGLFFLFHNARATAQTDDGKYLDFIANNRTIPLVLVVPAWQAIVGLSFGSLVVLITLLELLRTHQRISDGSVQQLQIPSIFVRAFADSSAFPSSFFDLLVLETKAPVNVRKLPLLSVVFGPPPGSTECVVIGAVPPANVLKKQAIADK